MKTLFLSIIISAILISEKSGLIIEKDKVFLSIDRNTSPEQIADYQKELLKKKIKLGIRKVSYDGNHRIKYIEIVVDCNDGFKGTSGLTLLDDNTRLGFYRIYNTKGSPFGMSPRP